MIQVQDLSITYGKRCVLQNVDLDVPPQKITALVGPSGCGKSSFLSALNRLTDLIPEACVGGQVHLNGTDIRTLPPIALRRRVGMIFQQPNPFPMSVRMNVELALQEHGLGSRKERREITEQVLRDVGLWNEVSDRLDQPAQRLSGGQQQRLCIARALALQPEALLLDEPCSALDPQATATIESLLDSLRSRLTLVVVTHNLAQARRLADQVAVFWNVQGVGQLVESGPCESLFRRPTHTITAQYLAGQQG